jgi:tryptophanyl-tRNA synthetase
LLYKTDLVPVGEDQKQHLELTRDIAGAFNRQYKNEYFKLPQPMIGKETKRIMSLQDGTKKMSKSDESDLSRINLSDDEELIRKKIKKCKTDSEALITYDQSRSEIYNLLNIFSAVTNENPVEIASKYANSGFGKFKEELAEAVISKLKPIQKNIADLKNDQTHVKKILKEGAEKAREIAATNMAEIKKIVGITI